MTNEIDILDLARTIYGEARGEKAIGKRAIACVVLNRFMSRKNYLKGATISETCKKNATDRKTGRVVYQFTCWDPRDPNYRIIKDATPSELGECYEIARDVLSGVYKDITCGSLHYHALSISPWWAEGKKGVVMLGHHVFYNDID